MADNDSNNDDLRDETPFRLIDAIGRVLVDPQFDKISIDNVVFALIQCAALAIADLDELVERNIIILDAIRVLQDSVDGFVEINEEESRRDDEPAAKIDFGGDPEDDKSKPGKVH